MQFTGFLIFFVVVVDTNLSIPFYMEKSKFSFIIQIRALLAPWLWTRATPENEIYMIGYASLSYLYNYGNFKTIVHNFKWNLLYIEELEKKLNCTIKPNHQSKKRWVTSLTTLDLTMLLNEVVLSGYFVRILSKWHFFFILQFKVNMKGSVWYSNL